MNLDRFVAAQDEVIGNVRRELKAGAKQSHWMWYVFPQIAGLGFSAMSQKYAISRIEEARAYMAHPVLGPRMVECVQLVLDVTGRSAEQIFGSVDAAKFQSSMTLFGAAAPDDTIFKTALEQYFNREPDEKTLQILVAF